MTGRIVASACAVALVGSILGCGGEAPKAPKPTPLPVTVIEASTKDVPDLRRYPGSTQAIMEATLIARITGFLEERRFEEGTDVEADEICFIIEPPPYEAAVMSARGSFEEAEAAAELARLDFERNEPLARSGAISAQELDKYATDLQSAEGRLLVARGDLEQAEINLSYTEVRAPFAGRIGERLVDVGNLVGADGGTRDLATIVQLDPMRVVFEPAGSQVADFLAVWPKNEVKVSITLPESSGTRTYHGTLDLVNNSAGASTSTFVARAEFPNSDLRAVPGLAADVVVDLGLRKDQIVVPEVAIQVDPQSVYLWTVSAGKLVRTPVKAGVQWNGLRVVTGIKAGTVVVGSTPIPLELRTGREVKPTKESLDDFMKKTAAKSESDGKGPGNHTGVSPTAKATAHDKSAGRPHSGDGK